METRVALIGIIVENSESTAQLNALLHDAGQYIIGRMGLPYRAKGVSIISVVLDAPQDVISALAGRIGRLPGVSAKTAYSKPFPAAIAENLGVKLVDFDTLLAESDVLSLHMNLTEENYHMFNKEAFMKCKKHPIIVNEGRGPLICDDDLVWALDNGYIRGAALDMVESEDPDLNTCPLVGRDDVLLTPHSGYYSDTSNYLVAKLSMDNALYYVAGEYDKVKSIRNGVNA